MKPGDHIERKVFEPSYYHTTIKQWPAGERPREKLTRHGPAALSEAELLAILLRSGSKGVTAVDLAKKLLSDHRSLRAIARMSVVDFGQLGIGRCAPRVLLRRSSSCAVCLRATEQSIRSCRPPKMWRTFSHQSFVISSMRSSGLSF